MITGAIKSQVDQVWNAFWSGGISNPLEVIEQITYLLFLRRLDDLHTLKEDKALRLKEAMARVFPEARTRGDARTGISAGRASRTLRRWICTRSFQSTCSRSCGRSAATTPPMRIT